MQSRGLQHASCNHPRVPSLASRQLHHRCMAAAAAATHGPQVNHPPRQQHHLMPEAHRLMPEAHAAHMGPGSARLNAAKLDSSSSRGMSRGWYTAARQHALLIAARASSSAEQTIGPSILGLKTAYQGVPGAYSEVAAHKACPNFDTLPCEQFEVAFQALSQWMAERAVLPIENSLGGSIHAVYDLLLRYRLHIVGETSLAINHCLVALPGTKLQNVKRVMSHPQALAQCDGYLRSLGVVKEAVDDTAGAAQLVARQQLENVGAVCSRRAAELYGLTVLAEGVQDVKDNITRFIVLSRDPLVTHDADHHIFKTSVVFSLGEGPGQLFKALSVFALRDIDMTKIESRPLRTNPLVVLKERGDAALGPNTNGQRFNYLFYVDFVGTLSDVRCQNALRHLQEIAPFLRVLGTYPMDTELGFTSSDDMEDGSRASAAAALS